MQKRATCPTAGFNELVPDEYRLSRERLGGSCSRTLRLSSNNAGTHVNAQRVRSGLANSQEQWSWVQR